MSVGTKVPTLVVLGAAIGGCGNLCGNDPLMAEVSPDQRHVAVVFLRDCGATTGFSTQVSILDAPANLPNEAGNVAVADGNQPGWVRWEDDGTLVVGGMNVDERYLRRTEYDGIKIRYGN